MDDNRYDSIEYDDNWQSVTTITPDYEDYSDAEYSDNEYVGNKSYEQVNKNKNKKHSRSQLLIKIQLFLCILTAVTAFALKSYGGELYQRANQWYTQQMASSLVIEFPQSTQ
ncbi:MAG TPA: hypothetical protein GX401_00185 [Clostridiales bacterium]|nr:hypothetical protein [Clostridiales bacterium]